MMNGMHTYHTNLRGRKRIEYPFLAFNSHHVIAARVDFQQTNPPTEAQFISKKVQESKSVQGPHLRDEKKRVLVWCETLSPRKVWNMMFLFGWGKLFQLKGM